MASGQLTGAQGQTPQILQLYQLTTCPHHLQAKQLGELVTCLAENICGKEGFKPLLCRDWEVFGCSKCQGFLSLLCGHTFCKMCLELDQGAVQEEGAIDDCWAGGNRCRQVWFTNVILSNLLVNGFPQSLIGGL